MDFIIAVPSYKRSKTCREKTIALLQRHNLLDKTFVFVVEEEKALQEAELPDVKIVVGVKGLVEQRRFITDQFGIGANVLMMDDDITDLVTIEKKSLENLGLFIEKGFMIAELHSARLWGISAVANPFFMKSDWSLNLKQIVGCFYGVRLEGEEPFVPLSQKEDFYRTCAQQKADGKVLRFNDVAPLTQYQKETGGLQETRTVENNLEGAQRVADDFPEYATVQTRQRTGLAEIRLKDKKKPSVKAVSKPPIHYGQEQDASIFEPLRQAVEKYVIPLNFGRNNSGVGKSLSLGILNRRNFGVGESRNNEQFPMIIEEAKKLASIICPEIPFTSMMLNENYEALPHKDKNNDGQSCVVAFGDFEGGELEAEGQLQSIRYKPFKFCASEILHSVKPITSGKRLSIVFFRPRFPKKIEEKYGRHLTQDEMLSLIPKRAEGAPASSVKIATQEQDPPL